ncbi:hypothetical protein GCM10009745_59500 [Kribbella yunnanensis]|uniref:N-acetyltransferase n=1 Tax=Kribbella yunnanensis TaxID=190194 RepID=A0ABN2IG28_9ACTN
MGPLHDAETFCISRIEIAPELQNRSVGTALSRVNLEHSDRAEKLQSPSVAGRTRAFCIAISFP